MSLERVEDVADEQRARAESASVASDSENSNLSTDLQSVRSLE